jgi:hypothetical protein
MKTVKSNVRGGLCQRKEARFSGDFRGALEDAQNTQNLRVQALLGPVQKPATNSLTSPLRRLA